MKIIATHLNADFDGFAAMLGLLKLHPDARLVFPGSKEPGLRQFLKEPGLEIPEIPVKDVQGVSHMILVDVAREDRLGALARFTSQIPRPVIEIYDHHPEEQCTLQADINHIRPVGATTTIVVHELMKQGSSSRLTSLEASILLAGIHEDTANFLSTGTTEDDFQAALFLLNQGAELPVVNRLLTHRLQPDQVAFFNRMVSGCEEVNVEGTSIVVSSFSWNVFMPEAAYIVHRLMDIEPISVFFALILMENRVHMIARSLSPGVDVGHICHQLGGGGHKMAASAVLKGVTLIEAREKLLAILHENVRRRETARDLMKPNIIQIDSNKKVADAAELMNLYRINSLVVIEPVEVEADNASQGHKVVGTISRQIVDGAIFHGLSERPLTDYMITDLPMIDPDLPANEILDRMISARSRFVLVGNDAEHVEGIVTRMDLLRFHHEVSVQPSLQRGKRAENLGAMLRKRLPEHLIQLLEECGRVAEGIGFRIFMVGGMVRDLLLHRENMDVDLVVEGDGIAFAEEFSRRHSCEVVTHKRFGTGRMIFPDHFKLDVATARTESYHAPAALPQVLGGMLRQDLYRRDFTINTLAIDLSPSRFGMLIDYFGGWDDLHQGTIRVLHSLSFMDDPTRTFRAIRFAARFNFQISKDTRRLIESAVESRVIEKLSGKRLWTELRNLLQEEHPIPAIRLLNLHKLLHAIHPQVVLDSFLLQLLYEVQSVLSWFRLNFPKEVPRQWLLYLMVLLEKLDRSERLKIGQRFQLVSSVMDILRFYKTSARDIRSRLLSISPEQPSSLYFALREYPVDILLYSISRASEEQVRQQIVVYLRDLRKVKLQINGKDLLNLGLPQGPKVKEVLDEVLRAYINHAASDRKSQLDLAQRLIQDIH